MGRDKVLGLSLAILLIGFAAAFCFRNDTIVESGLKLARTKILDEAIAQRPGPKPYTTEAKSDRHKSTLPTVTLQGVESVDPFSDVPPVTPTERSKSVAHVEKTSDKKIAAIEDDSFATDLPAESKRLVDTKPQAEPKPAALGPLTTVADAESASIDTQKAAPEIGTSKAMAPVPVAIAPKAAAAPVIIPGVASTPDVVESASSSSELLTSAAPPATDLPGNENQTASNEKDVRPSSAAGERSKTVVPQNVAWQSTSAKRPQDILADNSPRSDSSSENPPEDSSAHDNFKHEECTRTREISDDHSPEPPVAEKPVVKTPTDESGAIIKPLETNPAVNNSDGSAKMLTHRVRRGDTLSKISLHYLGDSRRYREIFEANRDQLHTPNDRLKIGMTLQIPTETARPDAAKKSLVRRKRRSSHTDQAATQPSGSHGASIHNVARVRETPSRTSNDGAEPTDDASMNSNPRSSSRFVPVRRSPFIPGSKTDSDTTPPAEKSENAAPAPDMSHLRIYPRTESVRIAGDRDDAVVR
jgi:nucleoid-associated protein YgaU